MKKTKVQMNKPIYLGTSILDISKILMHEIWYGYIKAKFGGRAKLCYIDTDSLIHLIMTENFYEDIANDIEIWFDTSNFDENDKRSLPIGKNMCKWNEKLSEIWSKKKNAKLLCNV